MAAQWTALQEALWTEKDEADCQKWRDAKIKDWDAAGKIKDKRRPARDARAGFARAASVASLAAQPARRAH